MTTLRHLNIWNSVYCHILKVSLFHFSLDTPYFFNCNSINLLINFKICYTSCSRKWSLGQAFSSYKLPWQQFRTLPLQSRPRWVRKFADDRDAPGVRFWLYSPLETPSNSIKVLQLPSGQWHLFALLWIGNLLLFEVSSTFFSCLC